MWDTDWRTLSKTLDRAQALPTAEREFNFLAERRFEVIARRKPDYRLRAILMKAKTVVLPR